jgi:hypothetical protein
VLEGEEAIVRPILASFAQTAMSIGRILAEPPAMLLKPALASARMMLSATPIAAIVLHIITRCAQLTLRAGMTVVKTRKTRIAVSADVLLMEKSARPAQRKMAGQGKNRLFLMMAGQKKNQLFLKMAKWSAFPTAAAAKIVATTVAVEAAALVMVTNTVTPTAKNALAPHPPPLAVQAIVAIRAVVILMALAIDGKSFH